MVDIPRYLSVDFSDSADGTTTLEAMASTRADVHPAALAEAQHLLGWAWQHFGHSHGPVDEGHDWHHDLQATLEPGGWHRVALTLTGSEAFMQALLAAFPALLDGQD